MSATPTEPQVRGTDRNEAAPSTRLMTGTAEEAEMIDRPSTQEGKDLLFMLGTHDPDDLNMVARVLAIEAASRAEERRRTVERIESFRYSEPLLADTPERKMWERNEETLDAIVAALDPATPGEEADPRWCHDKECFLLEQGVWGHPVSAHDKWRPGPGEEAEDER